ncbi:hypothetical protein LTR94_028466 [Friedmanniomyces endolithicus]|nr:hypothetical protein LTR94_028466 [Friedmanniomyces endolithicus]
MAGDEDSGVPVCFKGTILEAWADGRDPPDVMFHVLAQSGRFDSTSIIPPTSYKGSVDAAFVLSGIAAQMGYGFENSGVSARLTNPYYPGDAGTQVKQICNDIGCNVDLDEAQKILAIWPQDQVRNGSVVEVAASTGTGIQLASIYDPNITFGRAIEVESQFSPANGQWVVVGLAHQLDALIPNGQWMTEIECGYFGHAA